MLYTLQTKEGIWEEEEVVLIVTDAVVKMKLAMNLDAVFIGSKKLYNFHIIQRYWSKRQCLITSTPLIEGYHASIGAQLERLMSNDRYF